MTHLHNWRHESDYVLTSAAFAMDASEKPVSLSVGHSNHKGWHEFRPASQKVSETEACLMYPQLLTVFNSYDLVGIAAVNCLFWSKKTT